MNATFKPYKIRWFHVILTFSGLLLFTGYIQAQSNIANTRIELKENKIHVKYDIENSKRTDLYNITLEVTDSAGNTLSIVSVSGDVGSDIPGGNRKEIIWDLESDHIQMNAEIYFQVVAEAIVEPEPVVQEPGVEEPAAEAPAAEAPAAEAQVAEAQVAQDPAAEQTDEKDIDEMETGEMGTPTEETGTKEFNRAGLILQSVALPGLGLTRVSGKPHWLRGVAGYGCIAGAVMLNRMAISSYDEYLVANSGDLASSTLKQATNQDNISEICAFAAIGIWATDIVWTLVGTSNSSKPLSMGSGYDPVSGVPLLALRFKF